MDPCSASACSKNATKVCGKCEKNLCKKHTKKFKDIFCCQACQKELGICNYVATKNIFYDVLNQSTDEQKQYNMIIMSPDIENQDEFHHIVGQVMPPIVYHWPDDLRRCLNLTGNDLAEYSQVTGPDKWKVSGHEAEMNTLYCMLYELGFLKKVVAPGETQQIELDKEHPQWKDVYNILKGARDHGIKNPDLVARYFDDYECFLECKHRERGYSLGSQHEMSAWLQDSLHKAWTQVMFSHADPETSIDAMQLDRPYYMRQMGCIGVAVQLIGAAAFTIWEPISREVANRLLFDLACNLSQREAGGGWIPPRARVSIRSLHLFYNDTYLCTMRNRAIPEEAEVVVFDYSQYKTDGTYQVIFFDEEPEIVAHWEVDDGDQTHNIIRGLDDPANWELTHDPKKGRNAHNVANVALRTNGPTVPVRISAKSRNNTELLSGLVNGQPVCFLTDESGVCVHPGDMQPGRTYVISTEGHPAFKPRGKKLDVFPSSFRTESAEMKIMDALCLTDSDLDSYVLQWSTNASGAMVDQSKAFLERLAGVGINTLADILHNPKARKLMDQAKIPIGLKNYLLNPSQL